MLQEIEAANYVVPLAAALSYAAKILLLMRVRAGLHAQTEGADLDYGLVACKAVMVTASGQVFSSFKTAPGCEGRIAVANFSSCGRKHFAAVALSANEAV